MSLLANPESWVALLTLTILEIVLGIDNIVMISILSGKLPAHQQARVRLLGLAGALVTRIALLFSLTWVMSMTAPLFSAWTHSFSWRDLILIGGGLFLLWKGTTEIHTKLEGEGDGESLKARSSAQAVIAQIIVLDIVFSLDSVITAVGMANEIWIMVTAVIIAVIFMMVTAGAVSRFIDNHPTVKFLALSFLLLIGFVLVGEGFGQHISKGYIYFAMAFSIFVELVNMRYRTKQAVNPAVLFAHTEEPARGG
jgi:predicted tellurium resistance membrane protein TerC